MTKKGNIGVIVLGVLVPVIGVIILTQYAISKGIPEFFAFLIAVAGIFGVLKVVFRF